MSDDVGGQPGGLLSNDYSRAVEYARVVHADDVRKGTGIPYLAHLLSVSALGIEARGDEDQAIAALLHDAAEDHGGQGRIDAIREDFGDPVADIVEACSDSLVADPSNKRSWWDRKVHHLRSLESEGEVAALVSCADKLHNARAVLSDYRVMGEELWSRFNEDAGRRGELWYYRRMAEILPGRLVPVEGRRHPLGVALARTVEELWDAAGNSPDDDVPDRPGLEAEWQQSLEQEAQLLEARRRGELDEA